MNKKSITILVVCLIVSVMSVSLAFFSARIIRNRKLTYPIALMKVDEVTFAGGLWITKTETWYYKNSVNGSSTGSTYW